MLVERSEQGIRINLIHFFVAYDQLPESSNFFDVKLRKMSKHSFKVAIEMLVAGID